MSWYVYIAKCNDNTLYTGTTTDIVRRELEHNTNNKLGAKSLRGKRPVKIVYYEIFKSQSEAGKREKAIKNWKRKDKLKLIKKQKMTGLSWKIRRIFQGPPCKFRRNLQGP